MKTLTAGTPEGVFGLQFQSMSEMPISAIELADEDLEKVTGGFFPFFPHFGFGGFFPFFPHFGFGGFFPGFGFGGFFPGFGFGGFGGAFAGSSTAVAF